MVRDRFGCCPVLLATPLQIVSICSSVTGKNSLAISILPLLFLNCLVIVFAEIYLRIFPFCFAVHGLLENHGNL